jgi:uncharacterized membrane protein (DUF4010 family)
LVSTRNNLGRAPFSFARNAALHQRRQERTMTASHRIFYLFTFLTGALIGMGAAYAWAL